MPDKIGIKRIKPLLNAETKRVVSRAGNEILKASVWSINCTEPSPVRPKAI